MNQNLTFTEEEVEILKQAAEEERAGRIKNKIYTIGPAEKRYAFAVECNFHTVFHTTRTRQWAQDVKRMLRNGKGAANAKATGSRTGAQ